MSADQSGQGAAPAEAREYKPPPLVASLGRVARKDEYAARIAPLKGYWGYIHPVDVKRALAAAMAEGALSAEDIVNEMRRLQRERGLPVEPDLTKVDEDHSLRYQTAAWTDLFSRHTHDIEQILERIAARLASFETVFNRKLQWVFKKNDAERQALKAQATGGKKKAADSEPATPGPPQKKAKVEKQ